MKETEDVDQKDIDQKDGEEMSGVEIDNIEKTGLDDNTVYNAVLHDDAQFQRPTSRTQLEGSWIERGVSGQKKHHWEADLDELIRCFEEALLDPGNVVSEKSNQEDGEKMSGIEMESPKQAGLKNDALESSDIERGVGGRKKRRTSDCSGGKASKKRRGEKAAESVWHNPFLQQAGPQSLRNGRSSTFGEWETSSPPPALTDPRVTREVQLFYEHSLSRRGAAYAAISNKNLRKLERELRGSVTSFIKKGVVCAYKTQVGLGTVSAEDREEFWARAMESGESFFVKRMFARCSHLDFERLATDSDWASPLKACFVASCEHIFAHRNLLDEETGQPAKGNAQQWKKDVVEACRASYPRFGCGIEEVPLMI